MSVSAKTMPFGEVLEAIEGLTPDEQTDLVDIVRQRLAERERAPRRRRSRSAPRSCRRPFPRDDPGRNRQRDLLVKYRLIVSLAFMRKAKRYRASPRLQNRLEKS